MAQTPKEKAKELVEKFGEANRWATGDSSAAKACALICVEEMIKWNDLKNLQQEKEYWQQVKTEINNL